MFDFNFFDFLKVGYKRKKSILIVEDDVFLKPLMSRVVSSIDPYFTVKWANSVGEAQIALAKETFDLVISDCMFPDGTSGVDLWNICQDKYKQTPFMMVSGASFQNVLKMLGDKKTPPPFLHKPINISQCRTFVKNLLE